MYKDTAIIILCATIGVNPRHFFLFYHINLFLNLHLSSSFCCWFRKSHSHTWFHWFRICFSCLQASYSPLLQSILSGLYSSVAKIQIWHCYKSHVLQKWYEAHIFHLEQVMSGCYCLRLVNTVIGPARVRMLPYVYPQLIAQQMSCDLLYSRGNWKADDQICPFPLECLRRATNQLGVISIPVSCLVLFSPAAHHISEPTRTFKWCPLELAWAITSSTAAFTQH